MNEQTPRAHRPWVRLGGGLLMLLTKHVFARPRPSLVHHLVVASGFSFPSGHSLASTASYVTLALLA